MKRRQGFTLVELMVSMALIIFMMAILSQAFIAALGVFRDLKGQGDLAEKLRSTAQILQHDLAADHFGSGRRLSDPSFWNNGPPQQGFFQVYHGSASNVVGPSDFIEGSEPLSLINSFRSTDHKLAFTVKLVGNDIGDFMSASAAGSGNVWLPPPAVNTPVVPQLPGNLTGTPTNGLGIGAIQLFGPPESRYQPLVGTPSVSGYNSQWAAVAWFLAPQINPTTNLPDTTAPDPTAATAGFPLFTLYRRQCLLVPDNTLVNLATLTPGTSGTPPGGGVPTNLIGNFLEMSCLPDPNKGSGVINFNSPRDITMPANRSLSGWGGQPIYTPISLGAPPLIPPNPPLSGSDIQLNDVVSFDVRLLPLYPNGTVTSPNLNDPFVTLWDKPFTTTFQYTPPAPGLTAMVFDTWSSNNNGIQNYSQWNYMISGTPGTPGVTIPFWTTNPVVYQYPVGTGRFLPLPGITGLTNVNQLASQKTAIGSGPIIRAIQITIRIWDFKTNQTRQVTIVQAM